MEEENVMRRPQLISMEQGQEDYDESLDKYEETYFFIVLITYWLGPRFHSHLC